MFPDVAMSTRSFRIDGMMRFSLFAPRLYNLCLSLGFDPGTIMPSRAFCADESQGFPMILIPKHFGAFPFDHGRAGGSVATNRHGPKRTTAVTWSSSRRVTSATTRTPRNSAATAACRRPTTGSGSGHTCPPEMFVFRRAITAGGEGRTNWISTGSRRCPGSTG